MPRRFSVTQFDGGMNLPVSDFSGIVEVKLLVNTIAILKEVGDMDKEVTLRVEQLVDLRFLQK